MAAGANKNDFISINMVNQKQVGLDVALAITTPLAGKVMVTKL